MDCFYNTMCNCAVSTYERNCIYRIKVVKNGCNRHIGNKFFTLHVFIFIFILYCLYINKKEKETKLLDYCVLYVSYYIGDNWVFIWNIYVAFMVDISVIANWSEENHIREEN